MTTKDRAERVDALIEATPEAVDLRTEALALLAAGDRGGAIMTAWSAAERVIDARPEILRDVLAPALRQHVWQQVISLAYGSPVELVLKPALD